MTLKKRIYWLHPHFINWMGGHKYIYEIGIRLAKKYDLYIVADVFSVEAKNKFKKSGISVIQLGNYSTNNILYWSFLPLFVARDYFNLKKILKTGDIVISSMFPMNIVGALLTNMNIQICYEPFAFFYDGNFIKGFSRIQKIFIYLAGFLYSWSDKLATSKAKIILTISDFNRKWIKKIYNVKSIVVYEGVDLKHFEETHDKQLEKKYGTFKVIFHSTDFTRIKGTEYLFKSMALICRHQKNVKLLISSTIQAESEKQKLIKYAKENGFDKSVEFFGFLPINSLPAYLSLADVVVQPSVGQSMNLTIKEAMSCHTPVITSLEGKEQYSDGSAGFLVNPKNTHELSSKILKILKNKNISKKMGISGRKIVEQKFSWDAVYDKIESQINLL